MSGQVRDLRIAAGARRVAHVDLEDLAGDIASAAEQALGAVEALGSLASLAASGGLDFGGMLEPLNSTVDNMRTVASSFQQATRSLGDLFSS